QQRRVLELPERPFIGIADEVELLRLDDLPGRGRIQRHVQRLLLEREHGPTLDEPRMELAGVGGPFRLERRRDLAIDDAITPEDEPRGVSPGAGVPARSPGGRGRDRLPHGQRAGVSFGVASLVALDASATDSEVSVVEPPRTALTIWEIL